MHKRKKDVNQRGFTLIELLIVIAVIAIIAGVSFVALDPLTRFQDSRDSSRWSDVSALLSAIKVDQVDNDGTYLSAITSVTTSNVYMIGTGTSACDDQNSNCDVNVTADTHCVDLTGLVNEGYIGEVPISPDGDGTWTSSVTGYTLTKNTSTLKIQACESENTTEISLTR